MKKEIKEHPERENYVENRDIELIDFNICLKEVQKDKPSVDGKLVGMDYQQMATAQIFIIIVDQEYYTNEKNANKVGYVDVKEEIKILNKCVKTAKKVFGKEYDTWYNYYKENKTVG